MLPASRNSTCGGPAEREAFARIDELTEWRRRHEER